MAQTGTFLDRSQASDLRVVSYNVLWDSIFAENNVFQSAKFERVFTALDPDILNLQEIGNPFCNDCTPKTGEDVRVLLNTLTPLGGDGWQVYQGGTNVIA
ncbi:MAG: endonuclease/exonuclease/phosphatase family protein, partial [Lacipirellulaceae bacterium]